ncbi:hypothetical protein L1987_41248 [Smallanthus sonchifolius]|uniref:Uncharacterized protein n=1 Tax=Smallanthus sonchifolius TaxID=185202 RepID=A0ACB9GU80_9ASTR|nr:hypothetical protein L1987_41248 [Smallanthus sonchifolius]
MHSGDHEFSYEDASTSGPKKWGSLSADWKSCSAGKSQSPVNINSRKAKDQPNDLKMAYKEAPATLFNKGHNLVVQWQGDAGGIEVNGSTYKLVQCHWHTPSEHTIDEKRYDAELHFVHSNDQKQLAVIGVLFEVGETDPFIEKMTESKFKGLDADGSDLGKVSASSTTSGSKRYFRYGGSLTTPPCSEGVTWTVAAKAKTISKDQIKLLQGAVDHEFHENARPVQELNGRTVTQFEDKEGTGGHSGTESSSMTESKFKGLDADGSDLGKVSTTSGSKSCSKCQNNFKGPNQTAARAVDHEFHENARPVQELNGRTVTQFEDKE